jgi:hypothetical protein
MLEHVRPAPAVAEGRDSSGMLRQLGSQVSYQVILISSNIFGELAEFEFGIFVHLPANLVGL